MERGLAFGGTVHDIHLKPIGTRPPQEDQEFMRFETEHMENYITVLDLFPYLHAVYALCKRTEMQTHIKKYNTINLFVLKVK